MAGVATGTVAVSTGAPAPGTTSALVADATAGSDTAAAAGLLAIIAELGLADSLAVFVPLLRAMSVTPLRAA